VQATIIEWDGTNIPEELRQLPPGRYYLGVMADDDDEMSEEEEVAVMEGLADLDAGRVVPYETAMRELRSGMHD
jgi:hypothetical protein